MKEIIAMGLILTVLFISGCHSYNLREYKPLDGEKSITVPAGGKLLLGALKDSLKKNGWTLYVTRGPDVYRGQSDGSGAVVHGQTYRTRYNLSYSYRQYDWCMMGDPALSYDISIVDTRDGDEVMTLSGKGCQSWVIDKFEEWLNNPAAVQPVKKEIGRSGPTL